MKRLLNIIGKVVVPLLLAAGIMWWMYRGTAWADVEQALSSEMRWEWMLLSMPFGVLAQVFRATRWKQALGTLGERPRLHTAVNAIFLSYASSLVVPRVGELLRCGVLKRWDGTQFTGSVGTVVSERVVDMLLILLLTLITVAVQIPVFARFMADTGMSLQGLLTGFTPTGYLVTALCGLFALIAMWLLARRLRIVQRAGSMAKNVWRGMLSVKEVEHRWLFLAYSVGIWASYYLHFYLTFFCFDYSQGLGPVAALVAFVVGSFAVLVPTPNGAGSWHFAVKTVMVLYGVAGSDAAMFVLIVHTLQTLLVMLLGVYAVGALALTPKRG